MRLLVRQAVILNLQEEILFAEEVAVFVSSGRAASSYFRQKRFVDIAAQTRREPISPLECADSRSLSMRGL